MNDFNEAGNPVTTDRLVRDFKTVVADAEALLRATADDISGGLGDKAREARERLNASLDAAKSSFHTLESKALASMRATDRMIRDHPYQSLGIALGAGLLVGILMSRR